jgi:hypothetical protein
MRWPFGTAATVILVLLAVGIYFTIEPLAVLDYDGGSLAESLEGEVPDEYGDAECTEHAGGWRCLIETTSGDTIGGAYDLKVDEEGCWVARPIPYGKAPPAEPAQPACVDILDVTKINSFLDL